MPPSGPVLKHQRIVAELAREIRAGKIGRGNQLPGENALARRFEVSRTTIRNALAELSSAGLITTRTGKGSYVLFDGRPLDGQDGWAKAFAAQGIEEQARVVSIRTETDPALAAQLGRDDHEFVVVKRVRQLVGGEAISVETSWIPAVGGLDALLDSSADTISLTEVLAANSLFADHGTQRLSARPLSAEEGAELGRPEGAWFLHMVRTSRSTTEELVEHVECLLDPAHFAFELEVSSPYL